MDRINQSSAASIIPDQLPAQAVAAAMETEGTLEGVPIKYVTENGKRIIRVQDRTLEQQNAALSAQQAKDEEGGPSWKMVDVTHPALIAYALGYAIANQVKI